MPLFKKPLNIRNSVYALASAGGDDVELTFYGDVVAEQPKDWWTGEPIEGNYIIMEDFIKDLERLSGYKNITLRMNSYGGDCVAAFAIHNRLRDLARDGKNITCIVDGVAMSAASLIMCACDAVKVNPASLIMVHKCWSFLFGGYNADDLTAAAEQNTAYDKAIATSYSRKTGMSETEVLQLMADVTYMTGKEAVEKGFADELLEDADPVQIAASADGKSIFCRGRELHMVPGMFAPDFIPTIDPKDEVTTAPTGADNTTLPEVTGDTTQGGICMTNDELRAQYPAQVAEIEAAARAGEDQAVQDAVIAERQRLAAIDEIAALYPTDAVTEAKYGETACSASELALRMAQQQAQRGNSFLNSVQQDNASSGANDVQSSSTSEDHTPTLDSTDHEMSEQEVNDFMSNIFGKESK
jgi:ATP-dependent protease ClpP protease subunit